MSALPPTRPTFLMLSMPAMPAAIVQKMTSEMTIVMRRMKASPSGRIASPVDGDTYPTTMAMRDAEEHLSPQRPVKRFPANRAAAADAGSCGGGGVP